MKAKTNSIIIGSDILLRKNWFTNIFLFPRELEKYSKQIRKERKFIWITATVRTPQIQYEKFEIIYNAVNHNRSSRAPTGLVSS